MHLFHHCVHIHVAWTSSFVFVPLHSRSTSFVVVYGTSMHFKTSGLVPRLSTTTVEYEPKSSTATVEYCRSLVSSRIRVGMAAISDRIDHCACQSLRSSIVEGSRIGEALALYMYKVTKIFGGASAPPPPPKHPLVYGLDDEEQEADDVHLHVET